MSTSRQLMTNSEAQEEMARQYNEAKSRSTEAYRVASEAEKAANAKYKSAKRQVPQDIKAMEEAKAEIAKAKSDKIAASKIMDEYYEKERAFNNSQKSRVLGQDETKQDTIDKPTDTENLSEVKEPEAGPNTGSEPDDKQSNKQTDDKTKSDTNKNKKLSLQLGQSFYDNVASAIRGDKIGNTLDSAAKTAKEQAQNYRNRSAMNQMEAQRAQQFADRSAASEAGKIASAQGAELDKGKINRQSFVTGPAIARLRETPVMDVQKQVDLQLQQQNVANQRREEANTAQEESTAAEGDAETFSFKSRDLNNDRADAANLSMGTPEQSESGTEEVTDQETTDETDEQPGQQPEQYGTTWQSVMNYLTYGNDPTSSWNKGTKPNYQEAKAFAEAQGWSPIKASQAEFNGNLNHLQDLVKAQQPEFYKAWQSGSKRFREDGSQVNRGDKDDTVIDSSRTDENDIKSDERIKNVITCLSDLRLKSIREAYDRDGSCSPEDFMWLAVHTGGKFNHNNHDYDFFNNDDWANDDGSVLSGYADYIKNYVYTYKPEATKIDSRIDPNQEHIGPMAQDIEKVNPACIKETPEGVKTVDTARLAMMNAGAIGDLARQMQDLVYRLKAIGVE